MAKSNLLSGRFIWEEFMDFVEDFGAQVDKYSYIGEHKKIFFFIGGLVHCLTFNQCLSYFDSQILSGWLK